MRNPQSGYALLIVLLMAALVLLSLSTAVPRLLTQGQREKEEELIFRGEQYRRAIGLFYKKYGGFPRSIEDLLETNERAFLRRRFPDPMRRNGEWRLIRVGPSGELIGTVNQRSPFEQPESASGSEEETSEPTETRPDAGGALSSGPGSYPIIGVASRSTARAIRVYQGYTRYNEWEFIYDPTQEALGALPGAPGRTQPADSDKPASANPPR
ncbi:MAG: hypothetical protein ACE5HL_01865 [Terriglobia bacterium]